MNLDKKTFILGVLSLSAVVLFAANVIVPRGAVAATAIYDKDTYQLQTGRVQGGGEALYVTDNRNGLMVAFVYNPNMKRLEQLSPVAPVMTAFPANGAAAGEAPRRGYGR